MQCDCMKCHLAREIVDRFGEVDSVAEALDAALWAVAEVASAIDPNGGTSIPEWHQHLLNRFSERLAQTAVETAMQSDLEGKLVICVASPSTDTVQ